MSPYHSSWWNLFKCWFLQMEAYLISLSQPLIFGDERDVVLARWNQLQAMYGTGVGYCLRGPVPYTLENPFCRLKTVVYNMLPQTKDEDGLVMLLINKKTSDVITQRQQLLDALFRFLGNKPNLSIDLEDIRESSVEGKTEVVISVTERLPTGSSKKVLASELAGFLNGMASFSSLSFFLWSHQMSLNSCFRTRQLSFL